MKKEIKESLDRALIVGKYFAEKEMKGRDDPLVVAMLEIKFDIEMNPDLKISKKQRELMRNGRTAIGFPINFENDNQKRAFEIGLKLLTRNLVMNGIDVTSAFFIAESWAATEGWKGRPSDDPNKTERVMIYAETWDNHYGQQSWGIERKKKNGKFKRLIAYGGKRSEPTFGEVDEENPQGGRFGGFFTTKKTIWNHVRTYLNEETIRTLESFLDDAEAKLSYVGIETDAKEKAGEIMKQIVEKMKEEIGTEKERVLH